MQYSGAVFEAITWIAVVL